MEQDFEYLLEDVLKRQALELDAALTRENIAEKSVLVTGAGGFIGAALCCYLLSLAPKNIILLEKSENDLYQIDCQLIALGSSATHTLILGDISDEVLLYDIFREHRPHLVFHTAAFKHVPLLETQPLAALRNNVIGTHTLVRAAVCHKAFRFVLLSTDKAVAPTSIMGASKRIAELIVLAHNSRQTSTTVVRFGNVLGSSGSVVPRFASQIAKRQSLTVTHERATRYFLSVDEAVRLVTAAVWLGEGGDILVPNLGNRVAIREIAARMIRESHQVPDVDPPIIFTGLRPGEKLEEELLAENEVTVPTSSPHVRRVVNTLVNSEEIEEQISELKESIERRDLTAAIKNVCRMIPAFRPSDMLLESIGTRVSGDG